VKEEFIKNAPLFAEFSDAERRAVAERMRLEHYREGELIFGKGDESDALYLIKEGWVRLTDADGRTSLATLGPGSLLGEADFFLGRERGMTARATAPLTVWVLDENAVLDLIQEHSQVGLKLGLVLGSSIVQYQRYLMRHLGHVSFMRDLEEEERQAVIERLSPERYASNEAIFRSGDAPSGIYFIETGSVRLIGDDDYTELGPGDSFGEMAVVSGKPHPNTAQAANEAVVWQLSPSDFTRLTETYPSIRTTLGRTLRSRLSAADLVQAVGMLQRMPIFANVPRDTLDDVAAHLLLRHAPVGEVIYSAGDPGDAMYFVESGQVELASEDEERQETLARLIPGDFFGEMALLTGKSRSETAEAVTNSNLWVLYRADFDNLLVRHPVLTVSLSNALRERLSQAEGSFIPPHLHQIAVLGGLSRVQLEDLDERLHAQTFQSGEVIYFEGRMGDTMYFIESGQVERSVNSPRGPAMMETLEAGDFFGETALMADKPHLATARAVTACSVRALRKSDLDDLIFKYPNLAVVLSRVSSERQYQVMDRLRGAAPAAVAPPAPVRRPSPAGRARPAARPVQPAPAPRYAQRPAAERRRGQPPGAERAYQEAVARSRPAPRALPPPGGVRQPSASRGVSRGFGRFSRGMGGSVNQAAVWFATRSPRVKIGILVLLVLIIWLLFIAAPSSIIYTLTLLLRGNDSDLPYAYAQSRNDNNPPPAVLILQGVRESGAVAALPFVETVTPTPVPSVTPADTPTITPTPTETLIPTWTPTPTPTNTPLPATATNTPLPATATDTPPPYTSTPRAPTETPLPTPTPTPDADYIVASVRKLTPCENQGKHHIYAHLTDINGTGLNGVPLKICWGPGANDCARPITENKEEGAGWVEFAMFKGVYSIQVDGAKSQVASGITPDFQLDELCVENDNPVANSRFHASFEVIIQRMW
jgi:CRP-like cAMP-binding protein